VARERVTQSQRVILSRFVPRLAALFILLMTPSIGRAQYRQSHGLIHGPVSLGPRVGRDFENHAWSVGGQVSVPVGRNWELRPSGDIFFPKDGDTGWQVNGDAAIHLGQGGGLYGGGGIAFAHLGGNGTKTGYNLFFGLSTAKPLDRTKPFAEFRWTFVNDTSPFRLAVGFNYRLSG
jgi:hypothetical protein